ncbi:hypothetical protein PQX77_008720 [Marasmius sp. AFHP31]|nr:hypothetical protein PQX77_008720 [Marasmius sp. AFHP31]
MSDQNTQRVDVIDSFHLNGNGKKLNVVRSFIVDIDVEDRVEESFRINIGRTPGNGASGSRTEGSRNYENVHNHPPVSSRSQFNSGRALANNSSTNSQSSQSAIPQHQRGHRHALQRENGHPHSPQTIPISTYPPFLPSQHYEIPPRPRSQPDYPMYEAPPYARYGPTDQDWVQPGEGQGSFSHRDCCYNAEEISSPSPLQAPQHQSQDWGQKPYSSPVYYALADTPSALNCSVLTRAGEGDEDPNIFMRDYSPPHCPRQDSSLVIAGPVRGKDDDANRKKVWAHRSVNPKKALRRRDGTEGNSKLHARHCLSICGIKGPVSDFLGPRRRK